jgi:hypothetical protein
MSEDDFADSTRNLIRSRARFLGGQYTVLAQKYVDATSQTLTEDLAGVSRNQKAAMGLLLARACLEDALVLRSKATFDRFLFRYGAHLKASVSEPGLTAAARLCLALAAERVFDALPSASVSQRADIYAMRVRLTGPSVTDHDWRATTGLTKSDFDEVIEQVARNLGDADRAPHKVDKRAPHQSIQGSRLSQQPVTPTLVPPPWLVADFPGAPDPLVSATANWRRPLPKAELSPDIISAWSAFSAGDYSTAHDYLGGILDRLGDEWGPSSGVDTLRTWNWLRLVVELAALQSGGAADARRSRTSASIFAFRCLPDDEDLLERLIANALDDFAAGDVASARAWCAYTVRLVADMGHEASLAGYTNHEKAQLRAAWTNQYGLSVEDSRSTASAAMVVAPRLKEVTQRLYLGIRGQSSPSRTLREASHELVAYLDEQESELFAAVLDAVDDAQRLIDGETINHRDLQELVDSLTAIRETIAASGSSVLQDFVAPLVQRSIAQTERASERLGDISRPQVSIQLTSSKVPFSAAAGSTYQLRFLAQNTGNATAESIRLHVRQPEIGLDSIGLLDALGPGAQAEINVDAEANGTGEGAVTLNCEITWSDSMMQQFAATQQHSAEDQGPVSWAPLDVNPFSLGTISDPQRLVGRDEDLFSLDALIAGGASAYITGHKRVGKTSLTRVLLKSLNKKRGWAGSVLALGRAIVEAQTAADIVSALLDEILTATEDSYPAAVKHFSAVELDESGNFARAANRWLKALARSLPDNARVVIAIDDFDELPTHLVEGPQADSLFLFLRSLVDEHWLNLIVVGSEVLPSIIQKQAHKLNQVVPVSVTNFASRESTAALVVAPSEDRLEWIPEAIDRVHHLCGGNPYYETLVAQRLWQTMREHLRSIVTPGDVEEAVAAVAHEASESHFVHLWADSSNGLDHTARSAVVASAVLRSVARAGGIQLAPAANDEVVRIAGTWIQTATTDELNRAIAVLKAREVLQSGPSDGSLLISIPLVAVWLLDAGSKVLDGVYSTSKHATATARMVTDSELVALSKQLHYRGEHVTEIRLKAWLEQFGDNYHQYLAFRMLRRMVMDGYFTSTKLQNTVLPRLSANVSELAVARHLIRDTNNQTLKNAYLIDHGVPGDSTQGTLSALAKSLRIKKANIVSTESIGARLKGLETGSVLFLLDDYSGTGTHLTKTLDQLLDHLSELGTEAHDNLHVVVGAGVVADAADLPKPDSAIAIETVGGLYLGDRLRPFHAESGVFGTDKERHDAEEMTRSIGKALLPGNPLGFGGHALLTLFEFNCPNNVAPIFWRNGSVSGTPWVPLFERMV